MFQTDGRNLPSSRYASAVPNEEKPDPLKEGALSAVESAAIGAAGVGAGVVATALAAPVTGVAIAAVGASAIVQGGVSVARRIAESRGARRRRKFEEHFDAAFANDDIEQLEQNEQFAEVVFQNYRRAMDAVTEKATKPLARLTYKYRNREPDYFFRGLGRTLSEVDAAEFAELQKLMSALLNLKSGVLVITQWGNSNEQTSLRLHPEFEQTPKQILAYDAGYDVVSLLRVLERNGLTMHKMGKGADTNLTGQWRFLRHECELVAELVEMVHVDVRAGGFDRD